MSSRRHPASISSMTNDNSVAILLTYGTARVLFAGDAEAREEESTGRAALILRSPNGRQGSRVQNNLT